jgi:hypothetical protein
MTSGKGPKNYTTTIEPGKTAQECLALLVAHDASSVSISYEGARGERQPLALSFEIATRLGPRRYLLPVRVAGTQRVLRAECDRSASPVMPRHTTAEHARRVAWRVMKDWLDSQLAIIEAGLAELDEVMLPWMLVDEGRTLYRAYQEHELKALDQ